MDENDISDDNPFKKTEEKILREAFDSAIDSAFKPLRHIDDKLNEIQNALEANTVHIELLEEAVSHLIDIPTQKVAIWYDHKEARLWINQRFYIEFERTEPDLLGLMFFKTSGQPKKKKLQYKKIANELSDENTKDFVSISAVRARVKRIQGKLDKRLATKGILIAKSKEFYFSSSVTDS